MVNSLLVDPLAQKDHLLHRQLFLWIVRSIVSSPALSPVTYRLTVCCLQPEHIKVPMKF